MKKQSRADQRIDLTLHFGESLFQEQTLNLLKRLLERHAPKWTSGLHIWDDDETGRRELRGDFAEAVMQAADERGELFHRLVAKYGAANPRRTGSVELRGKDASLIVIATLDELIIQPSSGRYLWGNSITLQIDGPRVGEDNAAAFTGRFATDACSTFAPWHASAHSAAEFDAKNVSREGSIRVVGLDVSRYLPGLFWLNFFGKPYCRLMGQDRLLASPAFETKALDTGVMVVVDESPLSWNTDRSNNARVLDHIGRQFFFDRNNVNRQTVAPDFGLAPLPRHPRFAD